MIHIATLIHSNDYMILFPLAQLGNLQQLLYGNQPQALQDMIETATDETLCNHLLKQSANIADAIQWLHTKRDVGNDEDLYLAHMDLKPDNILIRGMRGDDVPSCVGKWVISDFGISTVGPTRSHPSRNVSVRDIYNRAVTKTMNVPANRGYGDYQAPEVQKRGHGKIGRKSDVWSLAAIFCMVLTYALGKDVLVKEFDEHRIQFGTHGVQSKYFYSAKNLAGQSPEEYELRPAVSVWLNKLCKYENPGMWISCATQIIRKHLVVKIEGEEELTRPSSKELGTDIQHAFRHYRKRRLFSEEACPILSRSVAPQPSPQRLTSIPATEDPTTEDGITNAAKTEDSPAEGPVMNSLHENLIAGKPTPENLTTEQSDKEDLLRENMISTPSVVRSWTYGQEQILSSNSRPQQAPPLPNVVPRIYPPPPDRPPPPSPPSPTIPLRIQIPSSPESPRQGSIRSSRAVVRSYQSTGLSSYSITSRGSNESSRSTTYKCSLSNKNRKLDVAFSPHGNQLVWLFRDSILSYTFNPVDGFFTKNHPVEFEIGEDDGWKRVAIAGPFIAAWGYSESTKTMVRIIFLVKVIITEIN